MPWISLICFITSSLLPLKKIVAMSNFSLNPRKEIFFGFGALSAYEMAFLFR